jgi:RHS repeat-associated protein
VVSYGYDLNNRLTGVGDTSAPITVALPPSPNTAYTTSYAYDRLNQPTNVTWDPAPVAVVPTASAVTFTHSYNKVNQRTGQSTTDNGWWFYPTGPPATLSYSANALNQYTAVGAVTPTYDGNGSLTGDGTFTYGYDSENRLTSANGAGNTASYAYDGQGRRKLRTVNGTATVTVTDADNREVLEYDGTSGAILRWSAHGLGSNDVLNQINVAASTRATLIPDLQGSIIATLDSSSGALSKTGYSPFGQSAGNPGAFGYTGQRFDAETNGLYYYRARHYSPALGRFLQPDPIGYSGGINLYAYVGNDPLNAIDPSGLAQEESGAEQAIPLAAAAGGSSGGDGGDGWPPRKPPGAVVAAAGADWPGAGPRASAANSGEFIGPLIGKSGFRTSGEFAEAVGTRYQGYVDSAYLAGQRLESLGLLRGNPNTRLGDYVDRISARDLKAYLRSEGVSEGSHGIVQMNRWLRDPAGSGLYVRPDVRIPAAGRIYDATVGFKPYNSTQITLFGRYSGGDRITVIRPSPMGSYSIVP